MKNLFLKTMNTETVQTPPIWMMRQAGRYHRHYQNLRSQNSFMDLCLKPELAAEVAMGPIQDFDFDAAILFSDLLFPFWALGQGLEYTEQGPRLGFKLTNENVGQLKPWQESIGLMDFQKTAMKITRERLPKEKALIGFVGGLWTLFVYSVEGSHAGSLTASKRGLYDLWPKFTAIMRPFIKANIQLQLDGGADIVMIFDTAAGELSPALYHQFIVPEIQFYAEAFPNKIGYYSKHTTAEHFKHVAFDSLPLLGKGFDHRFNIVELLKNRKRGFIQGNFDQSLLHLSPEDFKKVFSQYLKPLQELTPSERVGWVCGLGHGVLPQTPEANVRSFVSIVRETFK